MSSKVIDIFNTLSFISNYGSVGLTSSNGRLTLDSGGVLSIFNTTSSVNSSSGAIVVRNGGLSINSGNNATSSTSGGGLTINGGASISRDAYIAGTLYLRNTGSDSIVTLGGITTNQTSNLSIINVTSGSFTNISSSNLYSTNASIANFTVTNTLISSLSVANLVVSDSASLVNNSNTVGNIYTTGGNVGVNTTSPSRTLDVNGTLNVSGTSGVLNIISSNTTSEVLQLQNTNSSGASTIQLLNNSGTANGYIG